MNKIAIENGLYRAVSQVVVSRYTDRQQLDYTVYRPGEEFEISTSTGRVARQYVTYHPDLGDARPQWESLTTSAV